MSFDFEKKDLLLENNQSSLSHSGIKKNDSVDKKFESKKQLVYLQLEGDKKRDILEKFSAKEAFREKNGVLLALATKLSDSLSSGLVKVKE